jgi:hypothetical protein
MLAPRRTRHRALPALALVALLAGCGGGGGTHAGGGEAAKPADQIIADTVAALGRVQSFHLEGTATDTSGPSTLSGDVSIPGRLHIMLRRARSSAEIVLVGPYGYLKATRSFYRRQGTPSRLARSVADRWVRVPAATTPGVAEFAALTNPATIGHCLVASHLGTLTRVGTDSVDGRPVVVLADNGDVPGSNPGRLYVATEGPPLPLRATQTGPPKPGGKPDTRCNETDTSSNVTASDVALTAYDKHVDIAAPPAAVDLSSLTGQTVI